jgi:hypothetical protein
MLNELTVALLETNDGARAELFKLTNDPEGRSRADRNRRTTEAQAAAMLEFAIECGEQEKNWAKKIAVALDAAGFRSVRQGETRAFSPTSVINWRRRCAEDRHPCADFYRRLLDQCRMGNTNPRATFEDYTLCWSSFYGPAKSSNKKDSAVFWTALSELHDANTAFIPLPEKKKLAL